MIFKLFSVSAFKRLCEKFPWMEPCKATVSPLELFRTTLSPADYCSKYKTNFDTYCSSITTDVILQGFCRSYRTKCSSDSSYLNNSPGVQDSSSLQRSSSNYCSEYQPDYALHCINHQKDSSSIQFCTGYAAKCYGSKLGTDLTNPKPGDFRQADSSIKSDDVEKVSRKQFHERTDTSATAEDTQNQKQAIDWSN